MTLQAPNEGDVSARITDELLRHIRQQPGMEGAAYAVSPTRLTGGFDTLIYAFQLSNVPTEFDGPLVVRIFPEPGGAGKGAREAVFQNAIADANFPSPRVMMSSGSRTIPGRAFNVMERVPGNSLMESLFADPANMPQIAEQLAETLVELHAVPVDGVTNSLREAGIEIVGSSSDDNLRYLQQYIADPALAHLEPSLAWLTANTPPERDVLSICHGDYHPGNVMVDNGQVTGVLDWPGAQINDPEHDVAVSLVIVAVAAPGLAGDIPPEAFQMFADAFLASYTRRRALDPDRFSYHRAYRAMRAFARGSALRTPGVDAELKPPDQYAWGSDGSMRRLVSTFRDVTGIELPLPADVDPE
jgi:aminoglycoside phosphotransferase (APT) family kinase protein